MATTFLTLTNDTLRRLNEVELTVTDFPNATGFRAQAKDAINASLQEISQKEFEFPFNFQNGSLTLASGTAEYTLAADFKVADWDSFRINHDAGNNISARKLRLINYDTFLKRFFERDSEAGTGDFDQPIYVYRTLDNKAGFTPIPDKTYSISYNYFAYASELVNPTDAMTVPDAFKHVVIDGALYHCYMFRDNAQQSAIAKNKFEEGIDRMRTLLINRFIDVRDTRVSRLINVPHGNA
jgi:hypothetical protein|tara:strand:- start:140 stop:856 length:717 start_codon:yes stop_codon:yes gene_type:complete